MRNSQTRMARVPAVRSTISRGVRPRPISVRRYSASHSLIFSLRARLVPPVDCHVPTFLLTSTTLAGWPDLQHPTGLEGIAPTLGRLRVSSVSSSAQAISLGSRIRTCIAPLYRRVRQPDCAIPSTASGQGLEPRIRLLNRELPYQFGQPDSASNVLTHYCYRYLNLSIRVRAVGIEPTVRPV